jgi:hypothetical protein
MSSASTPRFDAALLKLVEDVAEMKGTLRQQQSELHQINKSLNGNGREGLLERMVKVESIVTRLLGHTTEHRKHSIKVAAWSTGAMTALILALKLVAFLLTGKWPSVP